MEENITIKSGHLARLNMPAGISAAVGAATGVIEHV